MTAPTDDQQLVADFVRRLRRVALHPLALAVDDTGGDGLPALPGGLLRRLRQVPTEIEEHGDGTVTLTSPLPDEVQFESLATRLRPFTLARDRLHWRKALDAVDRLTGVSDPTMRRSSHELRDEWTQATNRTPRARAYYTGYMVADRDGETNHLTDIELADAWLYQDVAHGDAASTGLLDITDRFRAAVSVFSHLGVVAMETLHYLSELSVMGLIQLPVGTFSDPVVVRDNEYRMHGGYIETDVGDDLSDPAIAESMPQNLRPALDLARRMVQERSGDVQSELVTVSIRRASQPSGDTESH